MTTFGDSFRAWRNITRGTQVSRQIWTSDFVFIQLCIHLQGVCSFYYMNKYHPVISQESLEETSPFSVKTKSFSWKRNTFKNKSDWEAYNAINLSQKVQLNNKTTKWEGRGWEGKYACSVQNCLLLLCTTWCNWNY